jgi:DNA segregation ATPase FtsK/SpoIIIE, S-DNA-T family
LKPRGHQHGDGRHERTGHHEQAGPTGPGEVRIPRQRDADTPRLAPPRTVVDERHRAPDVWWRTLGGGRDTARRALARVCRGWVWRAVGRPWVASWPDLACLSICTRAVRDTTRRAPRALRRWAIAGRRVAGWCWAHVVCPAARTTGRLAGRVGVWCWRRIEPYLRDTAGWLVHTAPGLAGRLLLRLLRWLPAALARLLRHVMVGLGWLLARVGCYCLAYPEYAGLVREARELDRPRRARVAIVAWRRAATRRSTSTLVLMLAAWLGLRWLADTHGTLAVVAVLAVLVGVLAGIGRVVRPLPQPEPELGHQPPSEPGPDEPYPIADAHTRTEAAECVRRALAAESIALRGTGEAARTPWGWEIAVVLRSGTPAGIVTKTGNLETHLDLPAGGLLVTPDRTRRARVVLRLAERDPFTGLGPPPVRGPVSITQRAVIGTRIDGNPLTVPLLGVHGVVIGSSGAGKSTTLLTLADAITACTDALVWDLDPAGCGLDALGPAIPRRERDPAGIIDALTDALALAQARPRLLADLAMGPAWIPSPTRPALVLIIDEYPRLPARAKELAVALLRIGRKARITLILAATEATSDALGAAIADTTALRILHACRHTDIRLVLGPHMLTDGWRPDRLHPATADDPGDAGRAYIHTAGNREPLISAIHPLTEPHAHHRATTRATLGLPHIDPQSWAAVHAIRHNNTENHTSTDTNTPLDHPVPVDEQAITDVLTAFGEHPRLWTEDLLTTLTTLHHRYTHWTPDDLATVLRPLGITPVQIKRGGRNRNGYHRDAITNAWHHHHTHNHDNDPPEPAR